MVMNYLQTEYWSMIIDIAKSVMIGTARTYPRDGYYDY